jgi:alkanesulfonate monooxygenase SsuD/methylene tetrahydromethanopterin reductase-like flavin-dependent oxidoreductase (luciferase family)
MKIGLLLAKIHASEIVEIAKKAEKAGLDSVWIPEMNTRDSITLLSGIATSTSRIRLATCIMNVYSRPPVLAAMTYSSLDELSNGRVIAGIGIGNPEYVTDMYSMKFQNGFVRLQEYLEILRLAFNEESFSYQSSHFPINNWGLGYSPRRTNLPIFVGAHNDNVLRFAGQKADGCILNAVSIEDVSHAKQVVSSAAKSEGRDPSSIEMASVMLTSLNENQQTAHQNARRLMSFYISRSWVRKRLSRSSFAEETDYLHQILQEKGLKGVSEEISDEMTEKLGITGTPEVLNERLKEYQQAGLDTVIIYLAPDEKSAIDRVESVIRALN